jgi:glycosyltransferase involved in cell wall biosynthesis
MDCVILIPAYNPDQRLVGLVDDLLARDGTDVVVVNDGSGPDCAPVFKALEGRRRCSVLVHATNRGKGAALKTGMRFFLDKFPGKSCLVTADADGQHLAEDVLSVAGRVGSSAGSLVLGVREFGRGTPVRSVFGNRMTSLVFGLLLGRRCSDTQTGLRGMTADLLPAFLAIPGDRFEYELDMLLDCISRKIPFVEVRIRTVYLEGNRSSHFNPLKDSWRIYSRIFRHLAAGPGAPRKRDS